MPHVLIVEDDSDLRELLRVTLELQGYTADTAGDGEQALKKMRDQRPRLVLLDLMMPVMDGWTFRARQLGDPAIADVPVICVSGEFDTNEVTARLQLPCLPKPLDYGTLLSTVSAACPVGTESQSF